MLIGCCHCGQEPPSESRSASQSVSQSASQSGSAPNYTYGICNCAAVPKTWQVVWPAMNANAPCPIAAGTYDLAYAGLKTFPGTAYGGCTWESASLGPRMKVTGGAWNCQTWTTAPPAFRVFVIPSVFMDHIELLVSFSVWTDGFGGRYLDHVVRYANTSASSSPCIHNGALTVGGSPDTWPNKTDTTFPFTFINLPVASTITLKPKI